MIPACGERENQSKTTTGLKPRQPSSSASLVSAGAASVYGQPGYSQSQGQTGYGQHQSYAQGPPSSGSASGPYGHAQAHGHRSQGYGSGGPSSMYEPSAPPSFRANKDSGGYARASAGSASDEMHGTDAPHTTAPAPGAGSLRLLKQLRNGGCRFVAQHTTRVMPIFNVDYM
jgi:hypothetical protein